MTSALRLASTAILVVLAFFDPRPMADAGEMVIYRNDFEGKLGSTYPEWTSSKITFKSNFLPPWSGSLDNPAVKNVDVPNKKRRILGEFGGPKLDWSAQTRVQQTIQLRVKDVPKHAELTISFDLIILRSWDGDSPTYGPDRFSVAVDGGPSLLAATFSNNPKLQSDKSYQSHPKPKSKPQAGAIAVQSLGSTFFGDSIYHFDLKTPHKTPTLRVDFKSDLYEGKGTADEAWGLDNVKIVVRDETSDKSPARASK